MAIKIKNITTDNNPIQLILSQGSGTITVPLRGGEIVWTPDPKLTNSLLIFQRRKLIDVRYTENKPDNIDFYCPYTPDMIKAEPIEIIKPKSVELNVQNVGGQIKETGKVLEEVLRTSDERGNKGSLPKELIDEIKKNQTTVLDEAKKMVEDYKESGEDSRLTTGRWTDEEEKLLRRNYPRKGLKPTAEMLNRSEKSVQKKVESLGLRKIRKSK